MGKINAIRLEDLDGFYDVTMSADKILPEGFFEHMRANVRIENGMLTGKDVGGSEWNASLSILDNNVIFNATVDPINAPSNTFMYDVDGKMSRDKQSYSGCLVVTRVGKKLSVHGKVKHGVVGIDINLTRLNDNG